MANTTFINYETPVEAAWLNDVNAVTYLGTINMRTSSYGAIGDGIADDTLAIQEALNTGRNIDLAGGTYSIRTVTIPSGIPIKISNGYIVVLSGGAGFSKTTVTVNGKAEDVSFDNVHFTKTSPGGSCIYINLAWQDSTGGILVSPNCSFTLSGGAIGIRLSRSFGNSIGGRFNMDATSTGILCDSTEIVPGDSAPSCPFHTSIGPAFFQGGTAFDQIFQTGSQWNSFEGFTFTSSAQFYSSKFIAKKYNGLHMTGIIGVSWGAMFDSGYNTQITAGYFDRLDTNPCIEVRTTIRNVQNFMIGGNCIFAAQGTAGDLLQFSDVGTAPSAQITTVNIGQCSFFGGLNNVSSPTRGIGFNHGNTTNVNIDGSQTYQALYSCINFQKGIVRSILKPFGARDITFYVENVATGYGPLNGTGYNRFDGIYTVHEISIIIPTYVSTGVAETVYLENLSFDNMMRPPIATVSNVVSPFGSGFFTITVPLTRRNSVEINLVKNTIAPGNTRGGANATIVLDSSVYIAPL
ncbi:MAG: hypothetical protein ACRCVT_06480 [Leadbetterella sp.]